eukprot:272622-Chlamydomonas_euryale.AAC.5
MVRVADRGAGQRGVSQSAKQLDSLRYAERAADSDVRRRTIDQTRTAAAAAAEAAAEPHPGALVAVEVFDASTAGLVPVVHRVCQSTGTGGSDVVTGRKGSAWRTRQASRGGA